jgi:hypothetical protein
VGIAQIPLVTMLNDAIAETQKELASLRGPNLIPNEILKLKDIERKIDAISIQLQKEQLADARVNINTKLHSLGDARTAQQQILHKLRNANANPNPELQKIEKELAAFEEERARFLDWEQQQQSESIKNKAISLGYAKAAVAETYITLSFIPETTNATVLSRVSFLFKPFEWIPGLGVALIGMTTLWEIYETILHKQRSATNTAKVLFSLAALVLTVAAFLSPFGAAIALGATVIGIGVLKEGINYYVAHKELKQAEKELVAKEARLSEVNQFFEKNPEGYSKRKAYAEAQVKCCKQQVQLLRAAKVKVRNNLLVTGVFILGLALLIFPPTSLAGAILLGGTFIGVVSKKIYEVRKNKSVRSQEQATAALAKESADENDNPSQLSMNVIHNSQADVYSKLPQTPPGSDQEIKNEDVPDSSSPISPCGSSTTKSTSEEPPSFLRPRQ